MLGTGQTLPTRAPDMRLVLGAPSICTPSIRALTVAPPPHSPPTPNKLFQALGTRGVGIYPDVLGAQTLLGYDLIAANCCKVLTHPRLGSRVYPATLFTNAPLDVLESCLRQSAAPDPPA